MTVSVFSVSLVKCSIEGYSLRLESEQNGEAEEHKEVQNDEFVVMHIHNLPCQHELWHRSMTYAMHVAAFALAAIAPNPHKCYNHDWCAFLETPLVHANLCEGTVARSTVVRYLQ